MVRLRRVSPRMTGFTRRKRGTGFSYTDADGDALPKNEVERIKSLAIPPAWTDVWICPHPNGHLQATGTDDAGRRQYLYHPDWRSKRDRSKFERITAAAEMLPSARRRIASD
ncbi:MAG TPA: DNA topoisomerase IB, partial [Propionibacterium sp.]|nr:DNA topoisomerase IB [Propionibacterium sp.]